MLIWVLVLISLIVFIVVLVKGYKAWGTLHTVLLALLYVECMTFLFVTSAVAHVRIAYTKAHDNLVAKVEKLTKTLDSDMYGDRIDPSLNLEKFLPLSNEVNRIALERGRVWRGAMKQADGPNGAILQLPRSGNATPPAVPPAAAGASAAVAPVVPVLADGGLAKDSVVHLFGENRLPAGLVPTVYLGEFTVVDRKDDSITVRPTATPSPLQLRAFQGSETCAVYEVMPIDSHDAFAAEGSKADEENGFFGRMDKAQIEELFNLVEAQLPPSSDPVAAAARKAKTLEAYMLDGGQAPERTLPERLAYRVTFRQDHSVDVDAKESRSAAEGGFYDLSGRAVDMRLKLDSENGNAIFKKDETLLLDAAVAKDLESQGVVSLGSPIYVRPLNDYEFAFRETRRMTTRARQDLVLVNRELDETNQTYKAVNEQEILRAEEGKRLALDKAQYDKELAVITEVGNELSQQIDQTKSELSQLYGKLVGLHEQLVKRSNELSALIGSGAVAP
ncbi:MAG: hypothetical protein ABL921_07000 [Pirellula sp.]